MRNAGLEEAQAGSSPMIFDMPPMKQWGLGFLFLNLGNGRSDAETRT